jgi:hypothetical protein
MGFWVGVGLLRVDTRYKAHLMAPSFYDLGQLKMWDHVSRGQPREL